VVSHAPPRQRIIQRYLAEAQANPWDLTLCRHEGRQNGSDVDACLQRGDRESNVSADRLPKAIARWKEWASLAQGLRTPVLDEREFWREQVCFPQGEFPLLILFDVGRGHSSH